MISCEAKPRQLHHLDADKAPRVPAYNGELNNPKGHMKLYTKRYRHYCGIDLHARTMHVCILDQDGNELQPRTSQPSQKNSSASSRRTATTWSSASSASSAGTG